MEILITHGWSEENAGDYAIENSIVNVINDVSGERNHFTFYSLFDKRDARLYQHNTLKSKNENISIISSFWGTPPIQYNTFKKILYIFISLIKFLFITGFLKLGISLDKRIQYFKKADLVVVKGGTFIYTISGLRGIIFGLRILYPIIISVILKKKIIVAPHSFGPFNNKLMDAIIFYYLRKLDWIYCRENESVDLLKKRKVERCSFLPDMAFYNEGCVRKEKLDYAVGITARPLEFLQKNKTQVYENYLQSMIDFIEEITIKYPSIFIKLIPQVIGPDPREDDAVSLKYIYDKLSDSAKLRTELIKSQLRHPQELITMYSELDILIGTRMHSIIFALLSGVKPIAISYLGPKHRGIMESFKLSEYVTGIDTIQKEFLVNKTSDLLKMDLSAAILKDAASFKRMIYEEFGKCIKQA